jgi:HK97 gp10 family phage protein
MPDMNLLQFIAHLAGASMRIERETNKALERAARLVEAEAKAAIGDYQPEAAPFAAWAQLADVTVAEKEKLGYAPPDNPLLRTGELRDSIDHAVGDKEAVVGSNSPVAEYQELGTRHIPPRSFLGGAAVRKGPEVAEILGSATVMALVGEEVAGGSLPIP